MTKKNQSVDRIEVLFCGRNILYLSILIYLVSPSQPFHAYSNYMILGEFKASWFENFSFIDVVKHVLGVTQSHFDSAVIGFYLFGTLIASFLTIISLFVIFLILRWIFFKVSRKVL